MATIQLTKAQPLTVSSWLNTQTHISLASLQGQVVIVYAFQMLCPGCVQHSLVQAKQLDALFKNQGLQVLGLHSVFEHHEVMTEQALKVFCQEFGLHFPIAIDQATGQGLPKTMQNYQMQGTPTFIAIDKNGYLRLQHFGHIPDLEVGSIVGRKLKHNA